MSLPPNGRLDHYEIIVRMGVGGMGEVYRARDTRLGRELAIKVLPQEIAAHKEGLNRFKKGSPPGLLAEPPEHRYHLRHWLG